MPDSQVKELPYPQVSQAQVDLWLADPVTKTIKQCLEWYVKDIEDEVNRACHVDPTNNDLTCNNFFNQKGRKEAFKLAQQFEALLDRYAMRAVEEGEE